MNKRQVIKILKFVSDLIMTLIAIFFGLSCTFLAADFLFLSQPAAVAIGLISALALIYALPKQS
jgi:nicotinamide riboside transporter PnuC